MNTIVNRIVFVISFQKFSLLLYKNNRFLYVDPRRDKKAFLSEQCKETEENSRMGKIRDLFKKIRDTKGTFLARIGTKKDRNSMDLTEAEDIRKRWQEYTEEMYKKDPNDPDNHDGVIIHLESDILECEVKWALGSTTMNKASGGDSIPVELFQILKDDAVKVVHSSASKFGKLSIGHRIGKGQFSFQSQRKAMPKNVEITVSVQFSSVQSLSRVRLFATL